jgi:BASS family bile acid:Na+ symporter
MLVVVLFYIQHKDTIMNASATTLLSPLALILCAITVAGAIGKLMRLNTKEQRTIIIEVGMQNAAQAIAIASSPFIFHNDIIAVPAIIYSLMMNLVLLTYVALVKK